MFAWSPPLFPTMCKYPLEATALPPFVAADNAGLQFIPSGEYITEYPPPPTATHTVPHQATHLQTEVIRADPDDETLQ